MPVNVFNDETVLPPKSRLVIYGTGSFAFQVFQKLSPDYPVIAFGDSYRKTDFLGLQTWDPTMLARNRDAFDVLVVASQYWREIVANLQMHADFDLKIFLPEGDQFKNTPPAESNQTEAEKKMKEQILHTRVMAIFYWGRSGTVFLQSLLDDHPETLMFPVTSLFNFHGHQWDKIGASDISTARQQFEIFIHLNPGVFDGKADDSHYGLDRLGTNRDICIALDSEQFIAYALERARLFQSIEAPLTRKLFFLIAHYAYAELTGQDLSTKNIIVYPLHDPENYRELHETLKDFPYLLGVGMIRHPFRTFYSHLRHWVFRKNQENGSNSKHLHEIVENGLFLYCYRHLLIGWQNIEHFFQDGIWVIRLEDLHDHPQETLTQLIQHLGLSWHPNLLKSTVNGHLYWSDGASKPTVQGFSRIENKNSNWHQEIGILDRVLIRQLLNRHFANYPDTRPSLLTKILFPFALLLPLKAERKALYHFWKQPEKRHRVFLNYKERVLSSIKVFAKDFEISTIGSGRLKNMVSYLQLQIERPPTKTHYPLK